jgi:DNA polymerase I-like protein with 3'-5' exonuclease and polymerase domains
MFEQMRKTGYLPIKSGRTVFVPFPDRTLPVASNYPIQGAAADVMYRAVARVRDALANDIDYPAKMVASIHDELLLLTLPEHGADLELVLTKQMTLAWLDIFPGSVTDNLYDSAVGMSWAAKP